MSKSERAERAERRYYGAVIACVLLALIPGAGTTLSPTDHPVLALLAIAGVIATIGFVVHRTFR